jgi:hypothetical protein
MKVLYEPLPDQNYHIIIKSLKEKAKASCLLNRILNDILMTNDSLIMQHKIIR